MQGTQPVLLYLVAFHEIMCVHFEVAPRTLAKFLGKFDAAPLFGSTSDTQSRERACPYGEPSPG